MYTSNDVLDIMDTLPMLEQLLVVEETLRKIRESAVVKANDLKTTGSKKNKHPILNLAGIWSDVEAEKFESTIEEESKIDHDEW